MGLRSSVLSFCAKAGWITVALLATLLATLFASSAFAAGPASPHLSWIEEDGSDLSVDWRTSSSWVWRKDQFALQIWIEVPKDLIEGPANSFEANKDLQVSAGGSLAPFKLRPDHLFIVMHMRGPTQLIKLKPTASDKRVRALRVEIPYSKTTWMRQSTCLTPAPYLTERYRRDQGPFFLALRCKSDALIQVQVSEDAIANIQAVAPAVLKGQDTIFFASEKTAPSQTRSQQLLANIEVKDLEGASLAEFELRRVHTPSAVPAARLASAETSHRFTFGLAAMILDARYHDLSGEHHLGGVDPALLIGWEREGFATDILAEARLSLSLAKDRIQGESASESWLRMFAQSRVSPRTDVQRLWGLQATSLQAPGLETGSKAWLSPIMGLKFKSETKAPEWTVLFLPFAFGSGADGWARAQINIRGEFPIAEFKSIALKAQAEGMLLRSFGNGDDGWAANGIDFGLRGEF